MAMCKEFGTAFAYWSVASYDLHHEKVVEIVAPRVFMCSECRTCRAWWSGRMPFCIGGCSWNQGMREYGVKESWTKLMVFDANSAIPVCICILSPERSGNSGRSWSCNNQISHLYRGNVCWESCFSQTAYSNWNITPKSQFSILSDDIWSLLVIYYKWSL